jgi:hypothetical protein
LIARTLAPRAREDMGTTRHRPAAGAGGIVGPEITCGRRFGARILNAGAIGDPPRAS